MASGGSGDATGTAAVGVKSGGRSEGWAADAAVWAGKALRPQTKTARPSNIAIAPRVFRGMVTRT